MKRIPFVTVTGGIVLSLGLALGAVTGADPAAAVSPKKPTPTPTASPTPTADGPGCFNTTGANLWWHRDVVPGSTDKLNAGEIVATVYLASSYCPGVTYRFYLYDAQTGSVELTHVDVLGNVADQSAVSLARFVHLGATDGVDTSNDFASVRLYLEMIDSAGNVVASAPAPYPGLPKGQSVDDSDAGSPALNTFH